MKKRGQLVLKAAMGLVVAVLIGALIVHLAIALFGGEYFSKVIASRESALQLNSLLAIYGNSYILTTGDITNFRSKFNDREIIVYSGKEEREIDKAIYSYVTNKGSKLDIVLDKPQQVIFVYTGGKLEVGEDIKPNLNRLRCVKEKSGQKIKKILIDAGHGDGTGLKVNNLDEAEITKEIANSLNVNLPIDKLKYYTRKSDEKSGRYSKANIQSKIMEADLIISIHVGSNSNEEVNNVKAYISLDGDLEEKKGLACSILNEISNIFELYLIGTAVIVVDISLVEEDKKEMLNNDKTAIFLEIGNIQKEDSMLADKNRLRMIGESIAGGINRYYKNE